jgi:hypothetical protein
MADSLGREGSLSTFGTNMLGGLLHVCALRSVMCPPLIGTAAAHTAAARHHASTTADHADDEQPDAHNRENVLQVHIRLQAAEIMERGTMLIVSSNLSVVPLSLQPFACLRS